MSRLVTPDPADLPRRVFPDYGGGSLVNLTATICRHFGVDTGHAGLSGMADLAGVDRVLCLVCDALGALQLDRHLSSDGLPNLSQLLGAGGARRLRLTSVFPSTTAAALSSLHTGVTPAEHGHLGYSVWLDGGPDVTDLLLARDRYTKQPRPFPAGPPSVFTRLSAAGVRCRVVNAAAFAESALSRWHFAGAEYRSWYSANTLPSLIAEALQGPGPMYVWAYWPDHDPVCHVHGPDSPQAKDELFAFDLAVGRTLARLPRTGHTLVFVTGDHGQLALEPDRAVLLDPLTEDAPAGDRTAAYLRNSPGLAARLAEVADVRPMAEVWAEGWFGGPPADPSYLYRTGDLLALTHPGLQFLWRGLGSAGGSSPVWRGGHGGWSPEEMWVPLISLRV